MAAIRESKAMARGYPIRARAHPVSVTLPVFFIVPCGSQQREHQRLEVRYAHLKPHRNARFHCLPYACRARVSWICRYRGGSEK